MPDNDVFDHVRRALQAAVDGETGKLISSIEELEQQGWNDSGPLILEALFNSVDQLSSQDRNEASAITRRAIARLGDDVNILPEVMEAEIRQALGESGSTRQVPRNLGLVHCIVAVGQIVHEGHLSLDQATVHDPPPGQIPRS